MKYKAFLFSILFIFNIFIVDTANAQNDQSTYFFTPEAGELPKEEESTILDDLGLIGEEEVVQPPLRDAGNTGDEETPSAAIFRTAQSGLDQGQVEEEGGVDSSTTSGGVQPGGLVPCEGAGCGSCELVQLAKNILTWLIGVMLVIFAIMTALAGFGLVTSGGNPVAKSDAKKKMTNAFVGIIVVLAAWLLVDTLMRALLPGGSGEISGYGPWSEIQCTTQNPTVNLRADFVARCTEASGRPELNEACGCAYNYVEAGAELTDDILEKCVEQTAGPSVMQNYDCIKISSTRYECETGGQAPAIGTYEGCTVRSLYSTKTLFDCPQVVSDSVAPTSENFVTYGGYQFDESILSQVKYLDDNFDLRVSGGYRTPERNAEVGGAENSDHLTGRAVDLVGTQAEMERGAAWARDNDARFVSIHNAGSGQHLHVSW